MAMSSDNAGSMFQQHCSGELVREDQKSFYKDILLSRMISAANSAAALAAATKTASINSLSASSLTAIASNIEDSDEAGISSNSLDLTNNKKQNKKLSFSVDSLLTGKEKAASIVSKGLATLSHDLVNYPHKKTLEEERAEEEEDLEVDNEEKDVSTNEDIADNQEETISVGEHSEDELRQSSSFLHYGTSNGDEESSSRLVVPKPLIPVSHIPNITSSPNLLAGIAQAMAAAAAASSRYNSLSHGVSSSYNSRPSESPTTAANSLFRQNSGLPTPHISPGFSLGAIGSRPSFLG